MKSFFEETLRLLYWILFCPSKIRSTIETWADSSRKSTCESDVPSLADFPFPFNGGIKFITHYLVIVGFSCLPLLLETISSKNFNNITSILLLTILSYSVSGLSLSLGFYLPLLIYCLGLNISIDIEGNWLSLNFNPLLINENILFDSIYSIVIFVLLICILYSVTVGLISILPPNNNIFILITFSVFTGAFSLEMACLSVAFVHSLVLDVIHGWSISIFAFSFFCIVISSELSRHFFNKNFSLTIIIITEFFLLLVGLPYLGHKSFISLPLCLIGWFRLIPDYPISLALLLISYLNTTDNAEASSKISLEPKIWNKSQNSISPISFFMTLTDSISKLHINSIKQLSLLPPETNELLTFPLPGHGYILLNAFHSNPSEALNSLTKLLKMPTVAFRPTLQFFALQVIVDQFSTVNTIKEIIGTLSTSHPFLPRFLPFFYKNDEITSNNEFTAITFTTPDTEFVLPYLYQFVKDLDAVSEAGSVVLRVRGLERLLDQLKLLLLQLPLFLTPKAEQLWRSVIEHWQEIIQTELEGLETQSQNAILNPFQFGNPLRADRSHLFKGRRAFSDQVYRLVLDRNRPTLVLHGPRRCGKSSFLLNLARLLPSDLVPIYLDMQRAGMNNSEADFCYGLVNAIYRDSRSQGIKLSTPPQRSDFYQNPYPLLEDWLDSVLQNLGERRLLLNLDEFEKIGSAIQAKRLSSRLFDELRSLIQHTDRLGFLFSGVQTLDELGPNWSSYFISVMPMEMLYLEPNEAEELLLDPDPEFVLRYNSDIIAEILHLTRCQPYLLQLIGSVLVTQANLEHTQLVTLPMLKSAIQDAFTQGEPYFTNVWTEFTGTTLNEVAAGQAYLLSLAGRTPTSPNPSSPDTQAAIRRLRRYHVIEQVDGIDRIEIPLFEQWVRERAIAD